jgi:hypothetical protein
VTLGSCDSSKEDRDSVQTHMPQSFYIEDELLLNVGIHIPRG